MKWKRSYHVRVRVWKYIEDNVKSSKTKYTSTIIDEKDQEWSKSVAMISILSIEKEKDVLEKEMGKKSIWPQYTKYTIAYATVPYLSIA